MARKTYALEKPSVTWAYLTPWLVTLALFWAYPLARSFYLSFTHYNTLSNKTKWIGFANYERMLGDEIFWTALSNTMVFVVGTIPFTTLIALAIAVLLNRDIAWRDMYRAAYFIPSVTSIVVLSLIFWILYERGGYINTLLELIGMPYPEGGWLKSQKTALAAIMAMDVWIAIGYYVVLFLAALQTISKDLYEAAELDGASHWQQFRRVTLPGLRPMLLFVIVINTIRSFQVFTEVYVMTKGGPLHSTTTLVYQVFEYARERADMMGYASAIAYTTFILILLVSLVQFKFLGVNREVGE
ncbi:MAG: sugar ABC transporter permease [bacterium]|nr:sugar ABC transporter permease [Candidatus Kapabacteria bacterium]